jgi:hypothetical protein
MSQDIEEKPGGKNAGTGERDPAEMREPAARRDFFSPDAGETAGTKNAALVFGNAFPAKETTTARTTRNGFARGMIAAALRDQFHCHEPVVPPEGRGGGCGTRSRRKRSVPSPTTPNPMEQPP